jgi:hypothetical protein
MPLHGWSVPPRWARALEIQPDLVFGNDHSPDHASEDRSGSSLQADRQLQQLGTGAVGAGATTNR